MAALPDLEVVVFATNSLRRLTVSPRPDGAPPGPRFLRWLGRPLLPLVAGRRPPVTASTRNEAVRERLNAAHGQGIAARTLVPPSGTNQV